MNEMPQGHVVLDGWNPEVERRELEAVEASRLRENRQLEAERRRQQAEVEAAKQQRRVAEQQETERRLQRRVEAMCYVVKVVVFIPIGLFKVVVVILLALVAPSEAARTRATTEAPCRSGMECGDGRSVDVLECIQRRRIHSDRAVWCNRHRCHRLVDLALDLLIHG